MGVVWKAANHNTLKPTHILTHGALSFRPVHYVLINFVPQSFRPMHSVPRHDRVVQDPPRSNNLVERFYSAFSSRVAIKHTTVTKLAKCIIREQTKLEMDIEQIRVGQEP
jgi:hypothetical protein